MNWTDEFLKYLNEKQNQSIPHHVVQQSKRCLLDWIGVAIGGYHVEQERMSPCLAQYPTGPSSILGAERKADPLVAAFLNGFNAHVLELDDGHRFGMIHLAAPIISAVISAAQFVNAPGERLLRGIITGYEAAVRLAICMQPSHKSLGFHTSGTCGTIGAAIGSAVTMGLNESQTRAALAAAASCAAGLLEIQEDASELKPFNVAHAAMSGLSAAMTGRMGLAAPDDILFGERGLCSILSRTSRPELLVEHTPYYEIERIYMKPFAACRHCHSPVEATLKLKREGALRNKEIAAIEVYTYRMAVKGHDHTAIRGTASAKLSIPYSVAAAWLLGECGIDAFSPQHISDPAIRALTRRVRVIEVPAFTALSPERRIADVHLYSVDETASKRIDYARGDPENPMTELELRAKYMDLMAFGGRGDQADSILNAVACVEDDAQKLYGLL